MALVFLLLVVLMQEMCAFMSVLRRRSRPEPFFFAGTKLNLTFAKLKSGARGILKARSLSATLLYARQ